MLIPYTRGAIGAVRERVPLAMVVIEDVRDIRIGEAHLLKRRDHGRAHRPARIWSRDSKRRKMLKGSAHVLHGEVGAHHHLALGALEHDAKGSDANGALAKSTAIALDEHGRAIAACRACVVRALAAHAITGRLREDDEALVEDGQARDRTRALRHGDDKAIIE